MTKLFINKAVNVPNVGLDTPDEKNSTQEYKDSYARQPVGVSGDSAKDDDPEVGRKWRSSESGDDTVESEIDSELGEDKKKSVKKGENAVDILKSFNREMTTFINTHKQNPTEIQFLKEVLHYSDSDIKKGHAIISGHNRQLFNEWVCSRLAKSVDDILRR